MWICRNAILHQDSSMLILSLIPWMKHWLHFTVTNKVQPNAQDSTDCRLVVVVGKSNTFQLLIWGQDVIRAVEQWCIYWWCTVHDLSLVFSVHLTVLQSDKQLVTRSASDFFLFLGDVWGVCSVLAIMSSYFRMCIWSWDSPRNAEALWDSPSACCRV